MARIRSVKPDTFTSATLAQVSIEARFLFIGMWTEADDDGRLVDSPKRLAGVIFPHDEHIGATEVRAWLDELVAVGSVSRYTAGEGAYLVIPKWDEHQKISHRSPSKLPSPPGKLRRRSGKSPEKSGEAPETLRPDLGKGNRNKEEEAHFDSEFEECWNHYPNKLDKLKARRCYTARRRAGVSATDLLSATKHYAESVRGTDTKYIKRGATFFGPDEPFRDFIAPETPDPYDTPPQQYS